MTSSYNAHDKYYQKLNLLENILLMLQKNILKILN